MAEAFDAWRKSREDLGEELADVAIYLLSLAEMTGVDLQDEIEAKMAKNAARVASVYHALCGMTCAVLHMPRRGH
jgi:NTP pyrophosphatase (non-canonical NTP hydrolase)